jgi:hypothetical protein
MGLKQSSGGNEGKRDLLIDSSHEYSIFWDNGEAGSMTNGKLSANHRADSQPRQMGRCAFVSFCWF